MKDKKQLREEIDEAFSCHRPYPGDEKIGLREPGWDWYEGEKVNAFLRGKHWQDISLDLILSFEPSSSSLLCFLSMEGFLYYLPGFLKATLDMKRILDLRNLFADTLVFLLTNPESFPPDIPVTPELQEHFTTLISSLTPKEKLVIVHVLEFLAAEYDKYPGVTPPNEAQEALDSYWGKLPEEDLRNPQDEK